MVRNELLEGKREKDDKSATKDTNKKPSASDEVKNQRAALRIAKSTLSRCKGIVVQMQALMKDISAKSAPSWALEGCKDAAEKMSNWCKESEVCIKKNGKGEVSWTSANVGPALKEAAEKLSLLRTMTTAAKKHGK